ncbi:AAA family ATPase [Paenibacillus thiaminolyticus]|uniref:AAA family ATPase n=1 Tax=Paenibacillus thiaminolyticus TaxID=49283 RepID=A0A3A3GIS8_PANTH|nr:AAA family ATPase [Paenibacillus thiaminolyticus]RJG24537.1 AAA family ATPase [Paenibacillus thiaminolyticus]
MKNRLSIRWPEAAIGAAISIVIFLAFRGVNILPIVLAAVVLIVLSYAVKRGGGAGVTNGGARSDSRKADVAPLSFEQIGGQERAKNELIEALDFLVRPDEIRKFGIRPLKGILLTGPPGTGKTLMAKAAAHYADAVFIGVAGSEFVEMFVGVGAGRVRELFKQARQRAAKEKKQNAVIFIDEIDVIGGKREGGQQREYDQTLNQLLTEMDGLYADMSPRILVMAATNRKEMLDSALLRPGRFDRHIQVDLPDKKGRLHILKLHAVNKPLADDVDLERIADETFSFSGAQLESVLNEGAIYAMRDESDVITTNHFSQAIDKVMMGEKIDRETNQEERRRVAIHELGHAIMAEVVRPGSVSQVALSPRGQALGYVRHQPQEERYLYTKPFLEEQIMIALGGAVAEEIFYGNRSTGSQGDFDQALNIVDTMVNAGLTELGIVRLKQVSPEALTRQSQVIMEQLFQRTHALLGERKPAFERILHQLLSQENLSGEQFRCLLCDRQ